MSMSSFGDNHNMNSNTRRVLQLQGPRPPTLMVSKKSTKVKKPKSPVVIYLRSPKIIHVRPEEFMGLVQRLTGKNSTAESSSSSTSSSCMMVVDENDQTMCKRDGTETVQGQQQESINDFSYADPLLDSRFSTESNLADYPSFCLNIYGSSSWHEFDHTL